MTDRRFALPPLHCARCREAELSLWVRIFEHPGAGPHLCAKCRRAAR